MPGCLPGFRPLFLRYGTGLAVLISSGTAPGLAHGEGTTRRDLPAVRLAAPPVIDGDLSDPCWQNAPRADRFTDALYGSPPPDQTVAHLGYDDRHIYVAFHAFDSQPQGIVARETKRGVQPRGDDTVTFHLDPFHTHRGSDRSLFVVNPRGTQFAQLGGGRAAKLEWEGEWQAAAKVAADGWTAEMAIPWEILNYPAVRGPTTCGINFSRLQQHTRTVSFWSNLGTQEFLEQDGHWVGVQFPPFRPRLSLLPYLSPGWQEQSGENLRSGLDLRSTLTPSLTLVGTVNPDFANVEEAVEGIDFSYGERFVPDRRPFFLEGANFYQVGAEVGRYFHSRRIDAIDTGVKLFGKPAPRTSLGVLAALDLDRRADWMIRGLQEFGPTTTVGLTLVNRDDERLTNRVLVMAGGSRRGFWSASASWANSWLNGRDSGSAGSAHFAYQTPRWYAEIAPHFIQPDFRDDLGFIRFTDYKGVNTYLTYSTEWRRGPLRSFFVTADTQDNHRYDGRLFRQARSIRMGVETRGDTGFRVSWDGGRFEQFDDSVLSLNVQARVSDPFHTVGLGYSHGRRAGAPYTLLGPYATWRFGQNLTLGLSSALLRHEADAQQHILTLNHDFSPREGIGGRLVIQTGGTNGYLSYRRSGYGGVETFLILGDPNAAKFTRRLVLKVVWPM